MIHLQGSDGNAACGADDKDNTTLRTQDVECPACVELARGKSNGQRPHSEASRIELIRVARDIVIHKPRTELPSFNEERSKPELVLGLDLWNAAHKFLIEQFASPMPRTEGRT